MPKVIIDRKLCKQCKICIDLCPRKLIPDFLNSDNSNNPIEVNDTCKKCRICEYHCPDFAIEII